MVAPQVFALSKDFTRPKSDPDGAKKLMTDAGYAGGFEVTMDCPNDRYVNDADICQAVVGMLARIGVKVNLLAPTQGAIFLPKGLKPGGYQTSFYLLGWTPAHRIRTTCCTISLAAALTQGPNPRRSQSRGYCTKRWNLSLFLLLRTILSNYPLSPIPLLYPLFKFNY